MITTHSWLFCIVTTWHVQVAWSQHYPRLLRRCSTQLLPFLNPIHWKRNMIRPWIAAKWRLKEALGTTEFPRNQRQNQLVTDIMTLKVRLCSYNHLEHTSLKSCSRSMHSNQKRPPNPRILSSIVSPTFSLALLALFKNQWRCRKEIISNRT